MTDAAQRARDEATAGILAILRRAECPHPDTTTTEIVAALIGHGWRPTNARPAEAWQPGHPTVPTERVHEHAQTARQGLHTRKDPPA